jgi:hypothetical protein
MHERVLQVILSQAVVALGLMSSACKQPMAAPSGPPAAHAQHVAAPAPQPVADDEPPPRDQFDLDEEGDDPGAALESMKHNCCDEMPAKEIRQHVQDPPLKK